MNRPDEKLAKLLDEPPIGWIDRTHNYHDPVTLSNRQRGTWAYAPLGLLNGWYVKASTVQGELKGTWYGFNKHTVEFTAEHATPEDAMWAVMEKIKRKQHVDD